MLLVQPCALLMAALWAVVPVGSHTGSLNAAMVSFQYGRRCGGAGCSVGPLDSACPLVGRLMVGVCQHISTLLNILWSRREPYAALTLHNINRTIRYCHRSSSRYLAVPNIAPALPLPCLQEHLER